MITLTNRSTAATPQLILLFGLGLIGTCILRAILRTSLYTPIEHPFEWNPGAKQTGQAISIFDAVVSHYRQNGGRIAMLWAAGDGGFALSEAEKDRELASFKTVLDLAERVRDRFSSARLDLSMLSSAGGLFEGQRCVTDHSIPVPKRPYGELKLAQEAEALARLGSNVTIYRPSSVYGFLGRGRRMGLIPTLLENTISQRTSKIFGDMSTLRDYVHADDIGDFIAKQVLYDGTGKGGKHILACGRPAAIFEIVKLTEQLLKRRVSVEYHRFADYTADNSYNARPAGWRPIDVTVGTRLVFRRLLMDYAVIGRHARS